MTDLAPPRPSETGRNAGPIERLLVDHYAASGGEGEQWAVGVLDLNPTTKAPPLS